MCRNTRLASGGSRAALNIQSSKQVSPRNFSVLCDSIRRDAAVAALVLRSLGFTVKNVRLAASYSRRRHRMSLTCFDANSVFMFILCSRFWDFIVFNFAALVYYI